MYILILTKLLFTLFVRTYYNVRTWGGNGTTRPFRWAQPSLRSTIFVEIAHTHCAYHAERWKENWTMRDTTLLLTFVLSKSTIDRALRRHHVWWLYDGRWTRYYRILRFQIPCVPRWKVRRNQCVYTTVEIPKERRSNIPLYLQTEIHLPCTAYTVYIFPILWYNITRNSIINPRDEERLHSS